MFPRLLKAYSELGVGIHLGNNHCMCMAPARSDGTVIGTGGGICIQDTAFFIGLCKIWQPKRIFCIGNAIGYGSFCLAEVFDCPIDAIDAEIEGAQNKYGSDITCQISNKHYEGRVQLTTGFSPQDLLKCIGAKKYDLVFIDGMHTNDQQALDFKGMQGFVEHDVVFYLHDVDISGMTNGFRNLIHEHLDYRGFNIDYSPFGCKVMVRGLPEVQEYCSFLNQSPITEHRPPKPYFRFNP